MTTAQSNDTTSKEDAKIIQQLQDELQKASLDDGDGLENDQLSSSSSSSGSLSSSVSAAHGTAANMLTASEQELAGKLDFGVPKGMRLHHTHGYSNNTLTADSFLPSPPNNGGDLYDNSQAQQKRNADMLHGVQIFFENQFIEAQRIFASQDEVNPVYALGSGALAFMKGSDPDPPTRGNPLHDADPCRAQKVDRRNGLTNSISKLVSSGWSYFGYKKETNKAENPSKESGSSSPSSVSSQSNGKKSGLVKPSSSSTHSSSSTTPNGQSGAVGTQKYMTNGEVRARVVRAEGLLLTSLILLLQESIMSYLKAGLNLRKGYKSYEAVWAELKAMGDETDNIVDKHTLGGIQFGLGTINIVLASMPAKILRIISSFGYTGDKTLGFDLVSKCIAGKGIRSPLGSLMFLSYYTILAGFAPNVLAETNVPIADKLLDDALATYKESAFFLYFRGRNNRIKGDTKASNEAFLLASSKATVEWGSELQRLCDYELGLNHAILLEWQEAGTYFERLAKENYWSRAFFVYFQAACLEADGKRTEALKLYQSIQGMVNRKFGGRTILVEQYVSRKLKLFEQNGFEDTGLVALEILLIWNAFSSMTPEALATCMTKVDAQISKLRGATGLDQLAVLKTIKGAILHQQRRHKEATDSLNWVIEQAASKVQEEKWVIPFACWEAGVGCWMEDASLKGDGQWLRAKQYWDRAVGFSGYEFEFRLSIRIHAAMMRIQEKTEQMKLKAFH
ncbi:hypothetical protein BGW38_005600 [Lunasporangiospora selenospora]|uniref:Tetratricopeptide repeat-containing protein n=1 Tax=Lunasporangiospora selenospora TaxID=979761 RepID=A0A9P6KGG1_9FUNG|nr:hypothetical protein BGW38_005600 [Lunasporangiospora selenospora]